MQNDLDIAMKYGKWLDKKTKDMLLGVPLPTTAGSYGSAPASDDEYRNLYRVFSEKHLVPAAQHIFVLHLPGYSGGWVHSVV